MRKDSPHRTQRIAQGEIANLARDSWRSGASLAVNSLSMVPSDDLALIPRTVRDKLDRVGIKLHLKEWDLLTIEERRRLVAQPCESAADIEGYRTEVTALIRRRTGRDPDLLLR